ncbi:MAG: transglutaminase-like domain-containing protein [Planctomycetota bacterium]|nr:transglutaminase-like domain-containing protein [Planctomycetota bacterium]
MSSKQFFQKNGLLWVIVVAACATPGPYTERSFVFKTEAKVPAGSTRSAPMDLWIPVPPSNGFQDAGEPTWELSNVGFETGLNVEVTEREGNRMIHLAIPRSPHAGDLVIKVQTPVTRFALNRDGRPDGSGQADPAALLGPDRLVPVTGPVADLAREVPRRSDPFDAGRGIFEAVREHMKYDKSDTGWGRGDATRACEVGSGNCTDYHALFVGMARSLGLPARFTIGYPLPREDGTAVLSGYHCWAEYYVEGRGWIAVDVSEADKVGNEDTTFFSKVPTNRVALTSGRDLYLSPSQQGPPLNFFIYPYVELGGRPFEGFSFAVHVKDG